MKTVHLIHGYGATVHSHWFDWLKSQLHAKDMTLNVIPLADSENPDFATWQQNIKHGLADFQNNDSIIGHSLGCISVLSFLSQSDKPLQLDQLILVGGFSDTLPNFSGLDDFIKQCKIDNEKIEQLSKNITVLVSSNDSIVPPALSYRLANELNADVVNVKNAGHFLQSDGITSLPSLLDLL